MTFTAPHWQVLSSRCQGLHPDTPDHSLSAAMDVEKLDIDVNLMVQQPEVQEWSEKSKGVRFWMVFAAICVSLFLSALEYVREHLNGRAQEVATKNGIFSRRCPQLYLQFSMICTARTLSGLRQHMHYPQRRCYLRAEAWQR